MALACMMQNQGLAADSDKAREKHYDLLPKPPMFPHKVKRVIFLYTGGGASGIDLWDYKPGLVKYDGKAAPVEVKGSQLKDSQRVLASPWKFQRYGQTGRYVSELLPHFAKVVDKLTFVRSMTTDRVDHSTGQFTFVTGRGFTGFPTIGAWVNYALGSENQSLPGYVVMGDHPTIGARGHSSAWLPPIYNGTEMRADVKAPMFDIQRPDSMSPDQQKRLLGAIARLNKVQDRSYTLDQDLEARIANYELAARMQLEALKIADLSQESKATLDLYGVESKTAGAFSKQALMARRLSESGVRFVQIYVGSSANNWDHHNDIQGKLPALAESVDQGLAALITDMDERGMFQDTLLLCSSEFGRLPTIESTYTKPGRDHNPFGFSLWMVGAGLKPGFDYGDTDEIGYAADRNTKCNHSDIHATVQYLLGLDYKKNTFPYEGRDESLIGINQARVLTELLA
jgi:hypothetical protein